METIIWIFFVIFNLAFIFFVLKLYKMAIK